MLRCAHDIGSRRNRSAHRIWNRSCISVGLQLRSDDPNAAKHAAESRDDLVDHLRSRDTSWLTTPSKRNRGRLSAAYTSSGGIPRQIRNMYRENANRKTRKYCERVFDSSSSAADASFDHSKERYAPVVLYTASSGRRGNGLLPASIFEKTFVLSTGYVLRASEYEARANQSRRKSPLPARLSCRSESPSTSPKQVQVGYRRRYRSRWSRCKF